MLLRARVTLNDKSIYIGLMLSHYMKVVMYDAWLPHHKMYQGTDCEIFLKEWQSKKNRGPLFVGLEDLLQIIWNLGALKVSLKHDISIFNKKLAFFTFIVYELKASWAKPKDFYWVCLEWEATLEKNWFFQPPKKLGLGTIVPLGPSLRAMYVCRLSIFISKWLFIN